MKSQLLFLVFSLLFTLVSQAEAPKKSVILVHGAFADGSSWHKVIPILEEKGIEVIAVQNPLTSLQEDVAFTQRAIEEAQGEITLVGHSWGGMVISAAGNNEKVKSLVYVSAIAPSENETIQQILHEHHAVQKIPPVMGFANPIVDQFGFLKLSKDTMINFFAPDIPKSEAEILAVTQGKFHNTTLTQASTEVAWRKKPSWYIVSTEDQMISPDVLRSMAKKINASTTELQASHVPMLSKPNRVAQVILEATGT